jgi:hypothetical protein
MKKTNGGVDDHREPIYFYVLKIFFKKLINFKLF